MLSKFRSDLIHNGSVSLREAPVRACHISRHNGIASTSQRQCLPRWQTHRLVAPTSRIVPRKSRRAALSTDILAFREQQNDSGLSVPSSPAAKQEKIGVLLLNLGGPEKIEDVQPFLYNLFADPDIIRLPQAVKFLQPVLATAISSLRAPKSAEGYRAIGGGSPLRKITEDQAAALAEALHRKGSDVNVYVAMRYWHPYTEEALEQVKRDGITQLVILPLYPQFSISTSGSSLRLLEQKFKEDIELQGLKHTVIPSWYQRRGYVNAMADLIVQELDKFDKPRCVEIFFSAHGVPKSYVEEAGDPYKEEMEECVALIMNELRNRGRGNHFTLAYQSRVGPAEWLKPYTDESIRELGASGVKRMLAVPISFVSEHIETLEEIDMEYRELAEESGIEQWGRVPALNTNPTFIDDLADAVNEALPYVGCMAGPTESLVPIGRPNNAQPRQLGVDGGHAVEPDGLEVWGAAVISFIALETEITPDRLERVVGSGRLAAKKRSGK